MKYVLYYDNFYISTTLTSLDAVENTEYIFCVLVAMSSNDQNISPKVEVEYCGACDYGGHCVALAQIIQDSTPNATVSCKRGRRGSFEVAVNNTLIYSKLKTMALPDYEEVAQVINDVSKGGNPQEIKGQQPINCVIS